jgi:hypothetical protein
LLATIDHLVYACPDLEAGIEEIARLLGVRASVGGSHPGWGTRNALVSLGPKAYLEIIGPDPAQAGHDQARVFGVGECAAPKLVTWAAKGDDLERLHTLDLGDGASIGEVFAGSRDLPEGATLRWHLTNPFTVLADGLVPFFINWGESPQPASAAARGATLLALRAEHPDPEGVRVMLEQLELELPLSVGPEPALVAIIEGLKGQVELGR